MNDERTEKRRRFIINVVYWAMIAVLVYFGIKITEPVLVPLIIAFVVAWMLSGPINWLEKKTHIKKSIVALLVVIVTYIVLGFLLTVLVVQGIGLLRDFFAAIPDFYYDTVWPLLHELLEQFEQFCDKFDLSVMDVLKKGEEDILQSMTGIVTDLSYSAISWASDKALSIPGLFLKTLITLIITVFITMDFHKIMFFLLRQLPKNIKYGIIEAKKYAVGTLLKCLRSYIIIMLITFVELLVGLSVLGVSNAPVVAGIIAIVDIMPVLGTGGVVIPWAIISLMVGDIPRAIGLMVLYLIILVVRNIIEPKIVGSQVGLHPAITLVSMFIGLHFFGILGMFALPISLSVVMNLNRKGIIHIFK